MGLIDAFRRDGIPNIPYSQANPPRQSQIGYYGQIATYPDELDDRNLSIEEAARRRALLEEEERKRA